MGRVHLVLLALAALSLAACGGPAGLEPVAGDVIVVTTGSPAPETVGSHPASRLGDLVDGGPVLTGSQSQPVVLMPTGDLCDVAAERSINLTFSISGRLNSNGSFDVARTWTWNGETFVGFDVEPVPVAAKGPGTSVAYIVEITITDPRLAGSGDGSFDVTPTNLQPANNPPTVTGNDALHATSSMTATVHYEFESCTPVATNTPPTLTLPNDTTLEATSSAGAVGGFTITADDAEDGNLSDDVVCTVNEVAIDPATYVFPIGETEVECSVTDSDDSTTNGSFFVYVQDTIAPVFTDFPADTTLIAADINGATIDLSDFDLTAKDWNAAGDEAAGEVSPPVTVTCKVGTDDADGFLVALGQTVIVSCTAADSASYRAPVDLGETAPAAPNKRTETFEVTVSLDLSGSCGFLPPLRNEAPFSAHRVNSTAPHKFCPPAYAGGGLATDLAPHLKLVLLWEGGSVPDDLIDANDSSAGSTAWRYDSTDEQYIFNLKLNRAWNGGTYATTVSAFGIELAKTEFVLRK